MLLFDDFVRYWLNGAGILATHSMEVIVLF